MEKNIIRIFIKGEMRKGVRNIKQTII